MGGEWDSMGVCRHGWWAGWSSIGVGWGNMKCGWDSMVGEGEIVHPKYYSG